MFVNGAERFKTETVFIVYHPQKKKHQKGCRSMGIQQVSLW